eukprot:TRINITY_DN39954_c0_g1_i1.p1 TRINITY_DN39954_c0_g1~~TRINITY_DN39954_c0_g1_i1.p1  ORF type:complete len:234 (+),score=112.76 TRINITY_DN39954_c0_g1_i1:46-702(+)
MEIEGKLLLHSEQDARKVRALLRRKTAEQSMENHFFDGLNDELSRQHCMLRVRTKRDATTAEVNIKKHNVVDGGSSCRFSESQFIALDLAEAAVKDPLQLLRVKDGPLGELWREYGLRGLKYLGGFRADRETFLHSLKAESDLTVKLDAVKFPFGQRWELEVICGQCPVRDVLDELEQTLEAAGVEYSLGTLSKFELFMKGCAEHFCSANLPPRTEAP